MATKTKTSVDNIEHLRKILSVDTVLYDINQEEALEFLDAIANERQELLDELKDLDEMVENQSDVDTLIKKLRDFSLNSDQANQLLEIVKDDDEDNIYDFVRGEGFMYVKVNNILDQQKLEAFIERRIYPYYNDQQKNVMF
jgi:DNA repair exonuclease SbcCD ATPase subunit